MKELIAAVLGMAALLANGVAAAPTGNDTDRTQRFVVRYKPSTLAMAQGDRAATLMADREAALTRSGGRTDSAPARTA